MIGHQAEGQHSKPEALAIVRQSLEIHAAIQIVTEDQPPVVAAGGDVVDGPGQLQAQRACHGLQ